MRSLQLLNLDIVQDDLLKSVSNFCVCNEFEKIYFADSCSIFCYDMKTRKVLFCSDLESVTEDGSGFDTIQMDYLIETQNICLSSSKGDIVVYSPISDEIECVGSVSSGLLSVAWSPDQEFLVLMTGDNTFILMTKEFDPVLEKSLHPNEFGEHNPINVGWGSKETQFQGSAGKAAAKVKKVAAKPAWSWDDHRHRISWRGDGQCFVTSVVDPNEGCRKLRIWSREGVLQCTSEIVDGLEHTLCWKPSGNLITSSLQTDKHKVIFFEKNGLMHGEFKLPFKINTFVVKELLWNLDSTILAMWGYETNESSKNFYVLLWTVNNYQWYLKQRLNFVAQEPEILHIFWDPDNLYRLHILCKEGHYYQYTWGWTVFNSLTDTDSNAVSAVINADDILVTTFGKGIVPPPMSSHTFKVASPANAMCFAQYGGTADFMVALADGNIAFFRQSDTVKKFNDSVNLNAVVNGDCGFNMVPEPYKYCGLYCLSQDGVTNIKMSNVFPYHWVWIHEHELMCIIPQCNSSSCDLLLVKLPELSTESDTLILKKLAASEEKVTRMCGREGGNEVAVVLQSGRVLKYKNEHLGPWLCNSGKELNLPPHCLSVVLNEVHGQEVLLALSDRFDLFCNGEVLVSRCTSFHLHGEFLLITTCDNTLQCFFMSDEKESKKGHHFQTVDQASQRIEKGSRIVRSIPGRTEVILQAPRGNLEVVHPRLLVLSLICQHLDNSKFGDAFLLMKRHRIDMNLLYDHNPEKFLNCVDMVIEQLGSSAQINLFLTSLVNGNLSSTTYQMVYKVRPRSVVPVLDTNKVNTVCDAVRRGIEKKNNDKLFQAFVTCYAKKQPPELDQALIKIKEMKGLTKNGEMSVADGALKLLLCLVDGSELYDNALGTYDFEIAIMVAEKTQKDPKQYIPFLNDLKSLEENYRKYKTDMELHRYKKALHHICKCGDHFDECLDLIKKQRLYKDALYLFPASSDCFKAVWGSYGDYLMEKKYFDDAGLAYIKSENSEKALSAYHQSLDWQSWLWILKKLNYPTLKNMMLCKDMAEKLKQNQKFLDAATLLESYVEDIEESIITLIEGQEWGAALRLMAKYNRTDIIETHLHPALKDQHESLTANLDQMYLEFSNHNQRLKTIRAEKQKSAFMCNGFTEHREDDLFSDTSSVSNVSSLSSTGKQLSGSLVTAKTGRSRRKQELKKYRLKEGSPNEDLAHIAAMSDIVTKVDKMKENFYGTLKTFVMFNLDSQAESLQRKMSSLCETIETEMPNIWQSNQIPQKTVNYGPTSTSNSIVADMLEKKRDPQSRECGIPRPEWHRGMPLSLTFLQ